MTWSTWRSIAPDTLCPRSGDGPAPAREAHAARDGASGDERREADPHADDPEVERQRGERDRDEDEQRAAEHAPHEEARVARADEDPVEREHRAVERLEQREQQPDLVRPV